MPKPRISQSVLAFRAANPACRLTFFACRAANPRRLPKPPISQSIFCISGRMSAHGFFACRAANPTRPRYPSIPTISQSVFASRAANIFQRFLCISDSLLHVGSRFLHVEPPILDVCRSLPSPRAFFASQAACRLTVFLHVGPPILHVRRTPAFSRGFFASRTAFFACRLTFLHVGQTYPSLKPASEKPQPLRRQVFTSPPHVFTLEFCISGQPSMRHRH